jgi:flagellar hook-associated protein 1
MGLNPALDIARRALTAHEAALGVIANNIANANTPGYTRQQPELAADVATRTGNGLLVGRGVHIAQIRRVIDPLIEKRLVHAESEHAGASARHDELKRLSAALSDLDDPSLSQLTDKFFDATDALARNPDGLAERESVLGAARALTAEFVRRRDSAATLQRTVDDRFVDYVGLGNDALHRVAKLNETILTREAGGSQANDLRDQRSQAVSTIAQQLGISVREAENDGTVLVEGGRVLHELVVTAGPLGADGVPMHSVAFTGPGSVVISRPEAFTEGHLGQLAQVRDGDIQGAITALDTVAASFVTRVNAIQTAGFDLDRVATTAQPLFSGTNAGSIAVAITDPRKLAAGTTAEPGDNRNALRLSDLRVERLSELNGASYAGFYAREQVRIGELTRSAGDTARASELVTSSLVTERNELSGVNLNEELVNLLRFQRAFQAAAQIVNVGNATLDELLNLVR